jgi:hypothetical protein
MTRTTTDGPPTLDRDELAALLHRQDGIVSRRQVLELRGRDWDIRRMVRRKELVVVVPGVYVVHTGPLSDRQRRWAAVLACWPAALARESALPGHEGDPIVHVAVAHGRKLRALRGVRIHRTSELDRRVQWNLSPPAIRLEDAALDVAAGQPDLLASFEVLATLCRQRRTRPERLIGALASRRRFRHRQLLLELLADLEAGACSVLEREYLILERRHGFPVANRQPSAQVSRGRIYRDVDYPDHQVVVELVGRAYHDDSETWEDDHERDLDTTVDSDALTVRLTYGQVLRHGCRTMKKIAVVLQRRGWTGELTRCPDCPAPT